MIRRLQGWNKLVSFQIKIYLEHYSFFAENGQDFVDNAFIA